MTQNKPYIYPEDYENKTLRGKMNQKFLQTKNPKGYFKKHQSHPDYPELVFEGWRNNKESWTTWQRLNENAEKLQHIEDEKRQRRFKNNPIKNYRFKNYPNNKQRLNETEEMRHKKSVEALEKQKKEIKAYQNRIEMDVSISKLPVPYKMYRGRLVIDHAQMETRNTVEELKEVNRVRGELHPIYHAEFKEYNIYGGEQWVPVGGIKEQNERGKERKKARRKEDPEWAKAQDAKDNQAKRDRMGNEAFLAHMRKRNKESYKKNPEAAAIRAARYEKRIRHMYKKLTPDLKKKVDDIYNLRQQLNEAAAGAGMYGKGFNGNKRYAFAVDHIMPVTHDELCGLHIPCNLKIIEADTNSSKSNKVLPSEC